MTAEMDKTMAFDETAIMANFEGNKFDATSNVTKVSACASSEEACVSNCNKLPDATLCIGRLSLQSSESL